MHVWVSGPTKMPTALDVRRSDVTACGKKCQSQVGLGSNPGEGIDICKCIVTLRHGDTLKQPSSRKSSREVGGREREVGALTPSQGVLPQNWVEIEPNHNVMAISLLRASNNPMQKSASFKATNVQFQLRVRVSFTKTLQQE
ncbi:hypothetical protein TNCV_4241661 [Trichonephila clavipes]|nr:hypothetical protein TNCV_4241661 [Trichonephila clavipes]